METIERDLLATWLGDELWDLAGMRMGVLREVYVLQPSGPPEWVTVETGMFGCRQSFVPVESLFVHRRAIVTSHHRNAIRDAPRVSPGASLDEDGVRRLLAHYDMPRASSSSITLWARPHLETGDPPAPATVRRRGEEAS